MYWKHQVGFGLNGQQLSDEDIDQLRQFINSLDTELGYPCNHRRMKRYASQYDSLVDLWEAYKKFPSAITRRMKRTTFLRYLKKVFPDFALRRAKEDECDSCIRLKMVLNDMSVTQEERDQAQAGLKQHQQDSRTMRLAMKAAILEYGKKEILNNTDIGVEQEYVEAINRLPDNIEDDLNGLVVTAVAPDSAGKPVVRIQCEDFGGNLCMPWYGSKRPGADYYLSNLSIYMFVISNLTNGKNYVYLYDERAMGKNADALCTLRFIYHMRMHQEARKANRLLTEPDTLYIIMDNCVGQNKSQAVLMFMSFLSQLFYKRVVCHYLVSGHSHMCPDRVVSHAKRSIGVNNIYHPAGLVEKMNTVSHKVNVVYLTHNHRCIWIVLVITVTPSCA
jgi:hypothetical protein